MVILCSDTLKCCLATSSRRGRFSKTNFQNKVFLDFLIVIRTVFRALEYCSISYNDKLFSGMDLNSRTEIPLNVFVPLSLFSCSPAKCFFKTNIGNKLF